MRRYLLVSKDTVYSHGELPLRELVSLAAFLERTAPGAGPYHAVRLSGLDLLSCLFDRDRIKFGPEVSLPMDHPARKLWADPGSFLPAPGSLD